MPRSKKGSVKVSYRRAKPIAQREKIHPAFVPDMKKPQGLSPLAQYIEDNADSGLTRTELVEQFQEYDCEHPRLRGNLIAVTSTKKIYVCPDCNFRDVRETK